MARSVSPATRAFAASRSYSDGNRGPNSHFPIWAKQNTTAIRRREGGTGARPASARNGLLPLLFRHGQESTVAVVLLLESSAAVRAAPPEPGGVRADSFGELKN